MQQIYQKLKTFGKVKTNEPMRKHTTFKIGGSADFFITVTFLKQLVELLTYLDEENIPYMILGGGSNMLFGDERYEGVMIRVQDKEFVIDDTVVKVHAGMETVALAHETMKAGLTGFEWGVGVPGTIGGAVRGNAGAMGGVMAENVEKVEVYGNGEVYTRTKEECEFGYRHSIFKENHEIVLRVWLKLAHASGSGELQTDGTVSPAKKKMLDFLKYRNTTQPQGYASTGCIFKNPDTAANKAQLLEHFSEDDEKIQQFLRVGKISAGWLIEQAGMKGSEAGDAEVSIVHGNFVVNRGNATAADVQSLIETVKRAVYNRFGIELEEEIYIANNP